MSNNELYESLYLSNLLFCIGKYIPDVMALESLCILFDDINIDNHHTVENRDIKIYRLNMIYTYLIENGFGIIGKIVGNIEKSDKEDKGFIFSLKLIEDISACDNCNL